MDETEELIGLCARAIVAQMSGAPGFELHMTRTCVLALTDEPLADFNVLLLGPDPDAEGFMIRAVDRAKARGLPLVATVSPHVSQALAPVATRVGLTAVGTAPLMLLRAETPVRADGRVNVTRALGAKLVGIAGDLAAAAFAAPRGVIARCIDAGVNETAGFETFIAWGDAGPMSAVTVTPVGNTAAISLMATPPEHQRKGMGRALLSHVIADYRARGTERFHLSATTAGRPLYTSLGFETIAELTAWVLPP